MFIDFNSLFSLDIGVDFGSYKTRAVSLESGVFYDKPSLISVYNKNKAVLAVGESSKDMIGRSPAGVTVHRPIIKSEISSNIYFELFSQDLISETIKKNNSFRFVTKPSILIPVNNDITKAQLTNFETSLKKEGAVKIGFLNKALVSFYGLPKTTNSKYSRLIIDFGHSKTNVGVVFNDNLVDGRTFDFGGQDINRVIFEKLSEEKKILVSDENIESYKLNYLILYPHEHDNDRFEVVGKSTRTGLPHKVELSYSEFREIVLPVVKTSLVQPLKSFINTFTENISNDIFEHGVDIIGGSAKIYSLRQYLNKEFSLKFNLIKNPERVLMDGMKIVLSNKSLQSKLLHI